MALTSPSSAKVLAMLAAVSCTIPAPAGAGEWSGNVAVEGVWFPNAGSFPGQKNGGVSISAQPEFRHRWDDGNRSFTFIPFGRLDSQDERRTRADIRELLFLAVEGDGDWELRAGIGRVFWGVTESQHLVNVINQIDYVEDFFGEVLLGQPMVRLTRVVDTGSLDVFVLPGFRERTYPGEAGRFRTPLVVDTDQALYEAGSGQRHVDWSVRWSQYAGNVDYGIYWFDGTSRDPQLLPGTDSGQPVLLPYYPLIRQAGLDAQYTGEAWLWKLETIYRDFRDRRWRDFGAAVGGFEYTLVGINDTPSDLGLLLEYHWDSRGKDADRVFQNDLFAGMRYTPNDIASTEVLAGLFWDLDYQTPSMRVEASRRFGDNVKVNLEAQWFGAAPDDDALSFFRNDDYVQLEVARYF
jgi:hypothetical protein